LLTEHHFAQRSELSLHFVLRLNVMNRMFNSDRFYAA